MSGLFTGGTSAANAAAAATTVGTLEKDVALVGLPAGALSDSISDIAWSHLNNTDILAVTSWDNKIRLYQVAAGDLSSQQFHQFEHEQPVLNCDFSQDGTKLATAGADKKVQVCDLTGPNFPTITIGMHDGPVRCVRWFDHEGTPMLATGSWDKTVKYWDLRQQGPVGSLQCQERVYSMDISKKLLVVATADRYINAVNLSAPDKFYKTMQSTLKWQTRVVSCFNDATGYAVGSIEGRCAIQYVEQKDSDSNFSFKCHRDTPSGSQPTNVFAVNDISFHPQHGTFSTAGSDGTWNFWDKDAKHRLKGYPAVSGAITATSFNRTGSIFAYAISYDWSKGYQANTGTYPTRVMLHPIQTDECKPRQATLKKK